MKKIILPMVALMTVTAGAHAASAPVTQSQLPVTQSSEADSLLKHFPQAQKEMVRHVITLPEKADSNNYQIELVIGKNDKVDCNRKWYGADLQQKTIEGFGYNYYQVDELTGPMSTMMGCLNNEIKEAFVTANLGQKAFINYNSRLPIVVYTPKDIEVKYRVWSTTDELIDSSVK